MPEAAFVQDGQGSWPLARRREGGGGGNCTRPALINDWRTGGEAQYWCIGASREVGNVGNGGSAVVLRAARVGGVKRVPREDLILLGRRRPLA